MLGGDTIWGNRLAIRSRVAVSETETRPLLGAEGGRKTRATAWPVRRAIGKQPCLEGEALGRGLLEEGDEVVALRLLLDAREDHLGARDVLFGVEQVLEEGVLAPDDALLDVLLRVREALSLASLAAEEAVEVRADLVRATSLVGVALGALLLESLLSFFGGHGGDVWDWMGCY